ncbi:hypothetical protein BX616_008961 [Lobosporangium transversale]|uniref:Uncharacterized protein n=1 Tax=Lobosporangium transversale TaxID=64571 RepID=A0A1Y2GTN9_9FUNG|nr:hypothetical protein BCR41DRAFT_394453 [Lobosporangium transversale]KAF9918401.1 hypothetical protein BX616_008961 [Lobosporangium transversale]ORZ22887.1 hypothetical protein BCR41DRAFT_394453 [Lobosporangium transversale]|eukprot:XP_021883441.1 hypothetical protein BCR41DRAFT_394453 [Lobosporangium transversale]
MAETKETSHLNNLPYDESEEDYHEFEEYDEVTKPTTRPFYKRRKYWIFCAIITVITVAVAVPIALFVILPKIAQVILNHSTMSFNSIQITNPTNQSMDMTMDGVLGNTGPFSATIKFPEPIQVYYNDVMLGSMNLPDTKASGGKGTLQAQAAFNINDEAAFGSFSADMLNQPTFTWVLKSKVTIVALGRTVSNLNLDKALELNGMGGFPDVKILKFDLPSDAAPGQGINLVIDTAMNNPSPIGVMLGTIVLDISYNGTQLGQVKATNANLLGRSESVLNLTGVMIPQTTPEGLATVSSLFSAYIAGQTSLTSAKGVSVLPDGVNEVSWLSVGLKSMTLKVPLSTPAPLNIIKSISLGPMGMNWTNTDAYAPLANSPGVVAGFEMPFGFSLNVTQVQNNMTVIYNNKNLATLNSAQWGPATTTKDANGTAINFALPPTPFAIEADAHGDFDTFVNKLTIGSGEAFTVSGFAGTIAMTPIGEVRIMGIPFKSDVSLTGLQGLKTEPTVINSLTVIGGVPEGLQIALNLTMVNPSLLSIDTGVGDSAVVTFAMQYEGDNVGTVIFPSLSLVPGQNLRTAGALFTPTGTQGGQALLQKYMSNQPGVVDIFGSSSSSAIGPLAAGLKDVQLQSTMPGNPAQLLLSTALTILDDTGKTGIAMATVTINNPFVPGLTIKSIKSTVQYKGRNLGAIDLPSTTIQVPGMTQQASQPLPLSMDLSIDSLLSLMIDQANANNLNAEPIITLGKMAKDPTLKVSSSVFAGFNLPTFVKAAMAGLKVDVSMTVDVMVGEYPTSLTLTQNGVPTLTDDTIMKLLPIVGTPIAQAIVDQATLSFTSVMINSPAETDFTTNINGLIANAGPFDSEISFPSGSSVAWLNNGAESPIGQIAMPTVSAKADVGAKLALTNVPFRVASADNMGNFVSYSLKAESFEWSVVANNMTVTAMGAPIPNINMKKTVTLKGFNGLQGLEIQKYDLPSNDPNGIHLVLQATLPNPSNVGIEMGTVVFENIFQGQEIGFVQTSGLKLLPDALTPIAMEGTLTKQTSEAGLNALGDLFRLALNGGAPNLIVKGKSVTPASGPVSWLSSAFSSLTMNVTLPSLGKQDIITGITLKTMTLDFTGGNPYRVMTSSDNIEATFKIPFSFPLSITQVAEDVNIQLPKGRNVANLKLPLGAAQTVSPGLLRTAYENQPLVVNDDAHEAFNSFSKVLTTGPGIQFFLEGTADTVAETAAGQVKIPGVSVNVASSLAGMDLNTGGAQITDIRVTGGTSQYLEINQNVVLQNPSGLTVKVGDVSFDISYSGNNMGRAVVKDMALAPGLNTLPAVFQLQPSNAQVRDGFLSGFVSGATFQLDIAGSAESTKVESLKDAMASVKMLSTIKGITDKLIAPGSTSQPDIGNMLQPFTPRKTPVQVMIYNPFDAPLYIKSMKAITTWEGKTFGEVNEEVGMTIPAKATVRSPTLTMVSPSGLGFAVDTLAPFMVRYPQLLVGKAADVPFTIESTIVALVGGSSGYEGNVQYTQPDTIINVKINGEVPKGNLPGGDTATTTTTAAEAPTQTTTKGEPTLPTSGAPSQTEKPEPEPKPTKVTEPPTETKIDKTAEPEPTKNPESDPRIPIISKRQLDILEAFPKEATLENVETWIKAMANRIALEEGHAAPNA